jgi:N-acetylglucosamine kinase-like BadF-type ATPase
VAGLRAVAAAFDGAPRTTLGHRLDEHFGIDSPGSFIRTVYADTWKVQALAPLVVAEAEAGDWVCIRILKTQANALAQRAGWLLTRTTEPIAPRLALMGGLVGGAYYRESLADALQRHLSGWEVVRPSRRPVEGALALAEKMAAAAVETNQEMDSGG